MLVKAHLSSRFSPSGWKNLFSDSEDVLISPPGDLKSVPPSDHHVVTGPNIPGDVIRELWSAAHAIGPRSDQLVNIRPFSGARPILDAFSMAADLKGKTAGESELGSHHRREAQILSLDDAAVPSGSPTKRMKNARALAEIWERMKNEDSCRTPEFWPSSANSWTPAGDSICSGRLI